jgi:hypothetical protein
VNSNSDDDAEDDDGDGNDFASPARPSLLLRDLPMAATLLAHGERGSGGEREVGAVTSMEAMMVTDGEER